MLLGGVIQLFGFSLEHVSVLYIWFWEDLADNTSVNTNPAMCKLKMQTLNNEPKYSLQTHTIFKKEKELWHMEASMKLQTEASTHFILGRPLKGSFQSKPWKLYLNLCLFTLLSWSVLGRECQKLVSGGWKYFLFHPLCSLESAHKRLLQGNGPALGFQQTLLKSLEPRLVLSPPRKLWATKGRNHLIT